MNRLLAGILTAATLVLSACGGGGGSPGTCNFCGPTPPVVVSPTPPTGGIGTGTSTPGGSDLTGAGAAGAGDASGAGAGAGSTSSSGSSTGDGAGVAGGGSGVGSGGTGGSTGDGTGVAGGGSGVGSGGTGGSTGDGTGVAGGGSGVGSGGTGATADAVGIGSVDGFGSIIVNGIRHNIDSATLSLGDAGSLQLGMTVRVVGTVTADLAGGTATSVTSAADMRGVVSALNTASGTFSVMGTTVSTDDATIFSGVGALSSMVNGDMVQVYGLPGTGGSLRATRVEKLVAGTSTVVTGPLQDLNTTARTFKVGSLTVNYTPAALVAPLTQGTLANGTVVRVRAASEPVAGSITATQVQAWYTLPTTTGALANVTGLVTDFASLSSFRLQGVAVNAGAAQVTGGPSSSVGNGVKVEVSGTMSAGTLVATKLRIRYVPGTGGPVAFTAAGPIAQFSSSANFKVQGQTVNASGAGVVFTNGTVSDLGNGKRVTVQGSQVVGNVLIATAVTFN